MIQSYKCRFFSAWPPAHHSAAAHFSTDSFVTKASSVSSRNPSRNIRFMSPGCCSIRATQVWRVTPRSFSAPLGSISSKRLSTKSETSPSASRITTSIVAQSTSMLVLHPPSSRLSSTLLLVLVLLVAEGGGGESAAMGGKSRLSCILRSSGISRRIDLRWPLSVPLTSPALTRPSPFPSKYACSIAARLATSCSQSSSQPRTQSPSSTTPSPFLSKDAKQDARRNMF
mmetsp:Transcript_14246/g.35892  ORF Transcript_14246/g.35892 Transcript_14246/m.35892 type:complete len:228 (+) Transcript_14246:167-850(+)